MSYQFRITLDRKVTLDEIIEYFKDKKCVIAFEIGKKTKLPHVHIHYEIDLKLETLRKRLIRQFHLKGNEDYHLGIDKGKSLTYTVKGQDIRLNTLITEEEMMVLFKEQCVYEDKKIKKMSETEKLISMYSPQFTLELDSDGVVTRYSLEMVEEEIREYITDKGWNNIIWNHKVYGDVFHIIIYRYWTPIFQLYAKKWGNKFKENSLFSG